MQQYQSLIMIALLVFGFYFLILRPQKKRQQAVQRTMNELTPGTRVLLNSGIFGTVTAVRDRQAEVEIAPGVELTIVKQAIARVVTEADEQDFEVDDADEIEEVDDLDHSDLDRRDELGNSGPGSRSDLDAVEPREPDFPRPDFTRPDTDPAGPNNPPSPTNPNVRS